MLLMVAVAVAVAALAYPAMPERIVTHWNEMGEPNGVSSRALGLGFGPIAVAVVFVIYLLIPIFDPKARNIAKFQEYFDRFMIALELFLFYVYAISVLWNLGIDVPIGPFVIAAIGCLFYAIGALLAHAEPNWTVGIRTPWTLSSEKVWKKTHQLGSVLFKVTALIALAGFFFPEYAYPALFAAVIVSALVLVIYSFVIFRSESKHEA